MFQALESLCETKTAEAARARHQKPHRDIKVDVGLGDERQEKEKTAWGTGTHENQ